MKKIIIALAVAAMAFAAQAALINGDFSGQTVTNNGGTSGLSLTSQIGQGWVTNASATQIMSIDGGLAQRGTGGANSYAGIGQLFTLAGTGAGTLKFDATVVEDATVNLDFWVQLYGYNQVGASTMLSADFLPIAGMPGGSNDPVSSANYDITLLGSYYHVNAGALSGTQTVNVNFNDSYEFYAIRILANRPSASDDFTIDNVVVAIPEPATALLFGIGGIGAWMVRRNRIKVKEQADA